MDTWTLTLVIGGILTAAILVYALWVIDAAKKRVETTHALAFGAVSAIADAAQVVDNLSREELRTMTSMFANAPRGGGSQSLANARMRGAEVHRNTYVEQHNRALKGHLQDYNDFVANLLREMGEDPDRYRVPVPAEMPSDDLRLTAGG